MSPNKEDYLKNILKEMEETGYAKNVTLSKYLNISKPSVSDMIKKLIEEDYVYVEVNKIFLTEKGLFEAKKLLSKHRLWETFLETVFNYDKEDIHRQADLLEHATSDKLLDKLNEYLNFPKACPHGSIIYENIEDSKKFNKR